MQALEAAQTRVDMLQERKEAAFSAWRANPTDVFTTEYYQDLKESLHKAEDILRSLATAAANTSGDVVVNLLCILFDCAL